MNSLPTHYHCWLMTPSFLNPKRNPMIPLEQKLLDLNLTVMSHHLETTLSRSEEHTSELQSPCNLVCRLLLEKKKKKKTTEDMHKRTCYPRTKSWRCDTD